MTTMYSFGKPRIKLIYTYLTNYTKYFLHITSKQKKNRKQAEKGIMWPRTSRGLAKKSKLTKAQFEWKSYQISN